MINFIERIDQLNKRLTSCRLCPHHCGVNRRAGQLGKCRAGTDLYISSANVHFGEEPPLSGTKGSGTIFFTHCNLACVFCQNYPISQLGNGNRSSVDELAATMLRLQQQGVHNINFVTPSHVVPQIVEAVHLARAKGLVIPLVYNCGGYEEVETLQLLDGIIDIYLPDAKYSDSALAEKYSSATDYWEINQKALREMYRQVGKLSIDDNGIARSGLLIRHLILPNNIAGSREVLEFIAHELSPKTYISLMAQYHPAHKSGQYPELSRRITSEEYEEILSHMGRLGLENGWQQEL
jgi:putative pyruvate formate lyase activating enzyme